MNEKMEQSKEARDQYLKEKGEVDNLVNKIIEEDKKSLINLFSTIKLKKWCISII